MPKDGTEYFMLLGPEGKSVVYYPDGKPVGPTTNKSKRRNDVRNTRRRIAALERKVEELGGTPDTRPEDVELGFEVEDLWAENETTESEAANDLGFEVRDLWAD